MVSRTLHALHVIELNLLLVFETLVQRMQCIIHSSFQFLLLDQPASIDDLFSHGDSQQPTTAHHCYHVGVELETRPTHCPIILLLAYYALLSFPTIRLLVCSQLVLTLLKLCHALSLKISCNMRLMLCQFC